MGKIIEVFFEAFAGLSVSYIAYALELILLFLLIFFVCKVLQDNNAMKLIAVYAVVIVLTGLWTFFFPQVGAWVFFACVLLASVFVLLLFSVEIKRTIWVKKNVVGAVGPVRNERAEAPETDACIEAIIRACQNMSKNDIGALIVLSNGNLPKQILESGTVINADISQQMIEGIFFPKAPLHDGALIIDDHRLLAAGCFLPLTQNNEKYSKDLGTRHRAGIGITEVTNVVSLIVSEETGIISIVKQGKITRYADYEMLRKELREYYWKDYAVDDHRRKNRSMEIRRTQR